MNILRKQASKLLFKFVANACGIFIGKNGTKLLCDPWLVDEVFDGSWLVFPGARSYTSSEPSA